MRENQSTSHSSVLRISTYRIFENNLKEALHVPHSIALLDDKNDKQIFEVMRQTDVLVWQTFKKTWIGRGTSSLRLVAVPGAGVEGVDFANLPAGCKVCNVYGHARGVAEHVFMLMLVLHRNLRQLDAGLRQGHWPGTYLPELTGRKLLVIGAGQIGGELVRWGRFLEMNVGVVTRSPSPARARELGLVKIGGLPDLEQQLPDADFVVVALPSSPETKDLMGESELSRMKPTAFLINVGRGPVVNERALYDALRNRRIAGAGIDVWYRYPKGNESCLPSSLPFQELDNVVMTPHNAGLTAETMRYRWRTIAENIARLARGEELVNVIWPRGAS